MRCGRSQQHAHTPKDRTAWRPGAKAPISRLQRKHRQTDDANTKCAHLAGTLVVNSLQVRRVTILDPAGQNDGDDDAVNGSRFAENDTNQVLGLNTRGFDGRTDKSGTGQEDAPVVVVVVVVSTKQAASHHSKVHVRNRERERE